VQGTGIRARIFSPTPDRALAGSDLRADRARVGDIFAGWPAKITRLQETARTLRARALKQMLRIHLKACFKIHKLKQTVFNLTFSQILQICEKATRRKLLGQQLAGANAFAANPDTCRHAVRISHGGVRNAG
jgi:hypothetical protein